MASSFTTNKRIEKPGNNDYVNTWNVPVNANFDAIDQALGGVTFLNATGAVGTVTLLDTQYRSLMLFVSGAQTGNAVYSLPTGVGGMWVVRNTTTGGSHTVTIASAGGGASVAVPRGQTSLLAVDGTDVRSVGTTLAETEALLAQIDVFAGVGLTGGGPLSGDVTLTADQATSADWRDNQADKLLNPNAIWGAMSEVALVDASSVVWDMQTGFDFIVTLGGNRAIANPTNVKVGQKGRLVVRQDGTGSRTLTWGNSYKFVNGLAPTLSTAANAIDVLYYDVRASNFVIINAAGRGFA
jgi:hypothetical protein